MFQTLIRGETISLAPIDTYNDEEPVTGGAICYTQSTKAQISMFRPSDTPCEHIGSSCPQKHSWGGGNGYSKNKGGFYSRHNNSAQDDSSLAPDFERNESFLAPPRPEKQYYARSDQRTLTAKNLSGRTTHKDIMRVLRGGLVLDVYLRLNDRSASISFVEGTAAGDFLNHVRRQDIYLHGKRVRSLPVTS